MVEPGSLVSGLAGSRRWGAGSLGSGAIRGSVEIARFRSLVCMPWLLALDPILRRADGSAGVPGNSALLLPDTGAVSGFVETGGLESASDTDLSGVGALCWARLFSGTPAFETSTCELELRGDEA